MATVISIQCLRDEFGARTKWKRPVGARQRKLLLRWARALSKYEQGSLCLVDNNDCFCSLGVAGDLFVRDGLKGCGWVKEGLDWGLTVEPSDACPGGDSSVLPDSLARGFLTRPQQATFIGMNDRLKMTFPEIAKFIRDWVAGRLVHG